MKYYNFRREDLLNQNLIDTRLDTDLTNQVMSAYRRSHEGKFFHFHFSFAERREGVVILPKKSNVKNSNNISVKIS